MATNTMAMLGLGEEQAEQPSHLRSLLGGDGFGNVLQAMGASLLSSHRNAPLAGFGSNLQGFQQMTMRQRAVEQEQVKTEEEKQRRALVSQSLKQVLPANLHSLADADPDTAMKLYQQMQTGSGRDESFFGTAVPMQDENGNIVLGQMSNQGRWQPLAGAEGYTPAPTTKTIDTGTEIITTDVYGNELHRTPKQNREAAYETGFGGVEGKADAESAALAESVQSKMPGLRVVIDELTTLADTATYTQSGQAMDSVKRELGLPVGQGAIDRTSYIAIVDNQVLPLLRDTFGAAFTEREGQTLRATLGDPNKSPEEKKSILNAFIAQKERDVAGMQRRSPAQSGSAGAAPSGGDWEVVGVTE